MLPTGCDKLPGTDPGARRLSPVMTTSESEGLGLSILIYMVAITGALAAAAVPVYMANAPQVYDNPKIVRANPLLDGPIVGNRVPTRVPLAVLKRETIVDPAILASVKATAKKEVAAVHPAPHAQSQRTRGTPVADLQPERPHHGFFLFNLFGG
jgi:hypothetical protein